MLPAPFRDSVLFALLACRNVEFLDPGFPQKEDAAKAAVKAALGVLEGHLQTRTYLVGDAITLADIITFCNLLWGFTSVRARQRCSYRITARVASKWMAPGAGRLA